MIENIGITIPGLIRFVTQVGFAIAGATSLWGWIFIIRSHHRGEAHFERFCVSLTRLYIAGLLIFIIGWALGSLVFYPSAAAAHEGIRLIPSADFIRAGFRANLAPVILLLIVSLLNIRAFFRNRKFWDRYSGWFWFLQFLILTIVSVFTIFTGVFDKNQLFHAFHNWHSILTLGTVIVVDFLVMATIHFRGHKKLYDFFHVMSSLIWIGLGLDFLSNLLILEEGLVLNQQFFFTQTVIAIIILNGTLLSGRITEVLGVVAKSEKSGKAAPLANLISLSGAVSITSWLSITFMDFFRLTPPYWQLLVVYIALIAAAHFIHRWMHRWIERSLKVA